MPRSLGTGISTRGTARLRPLRAHLTPSNGGLACLAVLIGTGAGLGAIVFRALISGATQLFTGHADYSDAGRATNPWLPGLGPWFVLAVPVVAGLVYGPLVTRFAPEAGGHGVPEVMLAVANNGGRIRTRVSVVKALASAICIGGGGSVGREGPTVQIGSAQVMGYSKIASMPIITGISTLLLPAAAFARLASFKHLVSSR